MPTATRRSAAITDGAPQGGGKVQLPQKLNNIGFIFSFILLNIIFSNRKRKRTVTKNVIKTKKYKPA